MTITEFILARIAEDEAAAPRTHRDEAAMRNLVGIAEGWIERDYPMFDLILRALAWIWYDHPDYNQAWS